MAFTHLLNGGALRAGDFSALHGALLTEMQPNTFNWTVLKTWQVGGVSDSIGLMDWS